ncbi:MAG: hypothetical protein ACRDRP_19725, partial [Pseudonocardiaceae bacterium]
MRPDIGTTLTTIEAALSDQECQQCRQPVAASPSPDFCSEDCQQTWQKSRRTLPPANGTAPDESISETDDGRDKLLGDGHVVARWRTWELPADGRGICPTRRPLPYRVP